MMNDKTELVKEAKNDKASRCWSAYQKKIRQNTIGRNEIRQSATQPSPTAQKLLLDFLHFHAHGHLRGSGPQPVALMGEAFIFFKQNV